MMKRILLFTVALVAFSFTTFAQTCTPDNNLPDTVIVFPPPYLEENPGSGLTDTACAGLYFETVINFKIPSTIPFNGVEVPIVSVDVAPNGVIVKTEQGEEPLPGNFGYACNPPTCVFEADTTGCIVLYGQATPADVGVYDLKVKVVVRAAALPIGLPFTLPEGPSGQLVRGNYYLHIKPEGSPNCTTVDVVEQASPTMQIGNRPNPFRDLTVIDVNAEKAGVFEFGVFDLLGRQLHRQTVQIIEGSNTIDFDGSALPNGMYIYSISNGREGVSGKMILNRS